MRNLAWDGYRNCRDLGGLPAADSVTVMGRVARGPRRESLTTRGWEAANAWGLRNVVDLRCADEVGRRDTDPEASPPELVAVRHAPTEDQSDSDFREICFPILDSPAYWEHNWRLQPHLVAGALNAIADAGPGTLVHCSAGRDRTGMIVALLLGNAGVDPDAVVDDYATSVVAMAEVPHAIVARQQGDLDEWIREVAPIVRDTAERAAAIMADLGVSVDTRARLHDLLIAN